MTAAIDDVERMRTEIVLKAQLQWTATTANICLSACLAPPQLHSASSVSPQEFGLKTVKSCPPMRIKKPKTHEN